jgi:hypothetical protein
LHFDTPAQPDRWMCSSIKQACIYRIICGHVRCRAYEGLTYNPTANSCATVNALICSATCRASWQHLKSINTTRYRNQKGNINMFYIANDVIFVLNNHPPYGGCAKLRIKLSS